MSVFSNDCTITQLEFYLQVVAWLFITRFSSTLHVYSTVLIR